MLAQQQDFPSALAFIAVHPQFPLLVQHQPLNYFTNESDQIDYRITHCFNWPMLLLIVRSKWPNRWGQAFVWPAKPLTHSIRCSNLRLQFSAWVMAGKVLPRGEQFKTAVQFTLEINFSDLYFNLVQTNHIYRGSWRSPLTWRLSQKSHFFQSN